MGTNATKPDSAKVEKSSKTCAYYTRNECKFGTNGKDCPFNHPEPCKQLILFGTKQPSGCNKGKKCKDFHPKMCPSSISKKECFNHGCHLTHIKGTTRKPKKTILEKDSNKQDQKQTNKPTIQVENVELKEPGSFLELARLIKEELMEAMDQKIALAITQHPQLHQPRLGLQQQNQMQQQPVLVPQHQEITQQQELTPQPLLGTMPHQYASIAPQYQIPQITYQHPSYNNQMSHPQLQYTQQQYLMPQNQRVPLTQPRLPMTALAPNPLLPHLTQNQF